MFVILKIRFQLKLIFTDPYIRTRKIRMEFRRVEVFFTKYGKLIRSLLVAYE